MIEKANKSSERWEIERTDRVGLVDAANILVGSMVYKTTRREGHFTADELNQPERSAYESALRFLARQFDAGPTTTRSHLIQSDAERCSTHPPVTTTPEPSANA